MTQKERSRKSYLNRKENGLCPRCGKELDRNGHYCSDCLQKANENNRQARLFFKSIGICPECRKNSLFGDEKQCIECREKQREKRKQLSEEQRKRYGLKFNLYQKELYKKRSETGICTRCGKRKAECGKRKCSICLEKDRQIQRRRREKEKISSREERRENNLCYFCGETVVDGLKVCERCRQRNESSANSENAVKARKKMKEEGRGFFMYGNGGRR